ncbi:thialysine N-epsilon-acetyltransferase isoform X2 [Hydra vulgaris]|uniref:Thialysine N-epsilon-acetyltransferase isoform X2 n=1 Tax=Hydra vulgaris TaxID=6087 RepID=A0ABM4DG70_HYDVU
MKSIQIRHAVVTDCNGVIDMIKELAIFQNFGSSEITNTSNILIRDGFGSGEKWFQIFVAEANKKENEEEKMLVGFVLFFRSYSSWNGRILRIDDIYVKPEFRGNGIGTMLLKEVAKQAIQENCVRIHWNVLDWNKNAKKFYEKCGAKVESDWQMWVLKGESLQNFVKS